MMIVSPFLARCLARDQLTLQKNEQGMFVLDRDVCLFTRVILPTLRHGYYDDATVDPLAALAELTFFGLATPSPGGLSVAEGTVLCRVFIDRVVSTLNNKQGATLVFFAEDVNASFFDTHIDVALLVTVLAPVLRARALMDYGLALSWTLSEGETAYSHNGRSYRVTATGESVYAYNYFLRPYKDLDTWTAVASTELVLSTATTTRSVRNGIDHRKGDLSVPTGPCPLDVAVTTSYDTMQKRTIVHLKPTRTGEWTSTRSYAVVLLSTTSTTSPLDTTELTLGNLADKAPQWSNVMGQRLCLRVYEASNDASPRNVRLPMAARVVAILMHHELTHDILSTTETARRVQAAPESRIVTQSRTRRICRLQAVVLSV